MNDDTAGLAELLRSPTFWIGTVVVGLLLNVAGRFIATRLENTTSGAFEAFRKGAARRAKKMDEQARRLTDHPGLVTVMGVPVAMPGHRWPGCGPSDYRPLSGSAGD